MPKQLMPMINSKSEDSGFAVSNLIASILKKNDAWLGESDRVMLGEPDIGQSIVENFPAFYDFKNAVISSQGISRHQIPRSIALIVKSLLSKGLIGENGHGFLQALDHDGHSYINGGWLEEHAYYCAIQSGADEVRRGQIIRWRAPGIESHYNEIDLVIRRGERLLLCSCKAEDPWPKPGVTKRITEQALEVDLWITQFFQDCAYGSLLTTTDLYDEANQNTYRYPVARHKAGLKSIDLVGLESLGTEALRQYFSQPRNWE